MEPLAERKIQKLGNSFLICLPKFWIDEMKIKKGDKISIYREGEKLYLKKGSE